MMEALLKEMRLLTKAMEQSLDHFDRIEKACMRAPPTRFSAFDESFDEFEEQIPKMIFDSQKKLTPLVKDAQHAEVENLSSFHEEDKHAQQQEEYFTEINTKK